MLGRQVFASAARSKARGGSGMPVRRVQFLVFVYVGALGGLAGIIHASLARVANPQDLLLNQQLPVLAAVVLGGARLEGGTGTLTGTLLGVALIVLVSNSLIVLGIPNTFQSIVIGS
jgi:simple sugar transport system permease protein